MIPYWKVGLIIPVLFFCFQASSYADERDVTLAWDANTESDLVGYKIYYKKGSSGFGIPRIYNGRGAKEGRSPIYVPLDQDENPDPDVVEFTVHGLSDDQTYFFVVITYEAEGLESAASREVSVLDPNSLPPPYDRGWEITSGDLKGVKMLYDSNDVATPTLGPTNGIPALNLNDINSVGVPLNLQPSGAHFNTPVAIFIPCPGYSDVSRVNIYFYDGTNWVAPYDANKPHIYKQAAQGWMVSGSRRNHPREDPGDISTIEIQVYHFSGVQAGIFPGSLDTYNDGDLPPSGCFISTLMKE